MSAGQGIGARRVLRARGSALFVALCTVMGLLLGSSASALADEAPEAPHAQSPSYIQPTLTYLEGHLNPGKQGEPGAFESAEYFFRYAKSATSCEGEGETEPGLSSGAGEQYVEQLVEGLEGDTQYTACLVARSILEHKEAVSAPVSFRTPEVPETLAPTAVTASSTTLHGVLNTKGESEPGTYRFVYTQSASECQTGEYEFSAGGASTGKANQTVEAPVSGLAPNTTYTACLVAYNNEGGAAVRGGPVTFKTLPAAPAVTEESASSVASLTATVTGHIGTGGLPTGYHVEYVSEAQYQTNAWAQASRVPAADAGLGALASPIAVSEELTGLQPETAYRFRFVAANARGTVTGTEATFTTLPSSATVSALPDERAYELVSPPNEGEAYLPPAPAEVEGTNGFDTNVLFKAALDGDAVAWAGEPALAVGTGETGAGEGNEWLSKRTSGGWQSSDITPTGTRSTVYQSFSSDLSSAILEGGQQPLTAQVAAHCRALYTRSSESGALDALFSGENCGNPLFAGTSADESKVIFQDDAALTPNAEPATETLPGLGYQHDAGGGYGEGCMFACNLYESSGGRLRLVNVLPGTEGHEGATVPNATFGGYAGPNALTTFSNAISTDGSRVFWTDTQPGPEMEHIYMLANGSETVQVSGSGPAEYWTATPDGRYAYYTEGGDLWRYDTDSRERVALTPTGNEATATGNTVGPTTGIGSTTEGSNVVTNVSTSNGAFVIGEAIEAAEPHHEGCGIRCLPAGATITAIGAGTLTLSAAAPETREGLELAAHSHEVTSLNVTSGQFVPGEPIYGPGVARGTAIVSASAGTLQLSQPLTAGGSGVALAAGGAEVQGVIGTNETGEDGAYVYFVADGSLAGTANTTCAEHASGCKLFVLHEGVPHLIATLDWNDSQISAFPGGSTGAQPGDWVSNLGERIVNVTPDGRHIVFQSQRALTGYDNSNGAVAIDEVYTYSVDDGTLVCNSCDPSGAPPPLEEGPSHSKLPEIGPDTETLSARFVSENGNRVFFNSRQPLVAQATDDTYNVYEWEREGEGSCVAKTPTRADGGCVYLLSGGAGKASSLLVGSDATGENVFFTHVGPLGGLEAPVDHNLLYDARVKGGFPNDSLACTGTGCQGVPPAPPIFAAPATATFSGVGNVAPVPAGKPKPVVRPVTRAQKLAKALKACRKDKKRGKRVRCERQAHARYGVKKAKKSANGPRAGNERRVQS